MSALLKAIKSKGYIMSSHCQKAMNVRNILLDQVIETVENGEVIAKYDRDKPFPSKLILKFVKGGPLHVVVARDPVSSTCILITAYWPEPEIWSGDFKTKKID